MDLDLWMDAFLNAAANPASAAWQAWLRGRLRRDPQTGGAEGAGHRASGDIHVYGNPHYWLDPVNGEAISATVLEGLKRVSPADADYFEKNRQAFVARLRAAVPRWQRELAPYRGRKLVIYHDAWPYFVRRFDLRILGAIEPKPGIPPTASHIASLIERVRAEKQPVVIADAPFYSDKAAKTIAAKTGAQFVVIPSSVGGMKGADDYLSLFDRIVDSLVKGFSGR
jgi:ABC-type Zn uptake system ZnuABC Zn-binding protein ZnuA